jgi:hypothetical protein
MLLQAHDQTGGLFCVHPVATCRTKRLGKRSNCFPTLRFFENAGDFGPDISKSYDKKRPGSDYPFSTFDLRLFKSEPYSPNGSCLENNLTGILSYFTSSFAIMEVDLLN